MVKKEAENGTLQSLKGIMKKVANFLYKRHIWPGLLAGFLWTFPVPFVLTAFIETFQNFSEEAVWILFFPLKISFVLTEWMMKLEIVDPVSWTIILWITSILVGMFSGVVFTYSIHLVRVRMGTRHRGE
ncbi:MAG: hypothetical protein OEX77_05055 [Candidatus Bathyarchaeota archaeon]|nr:hypothetical protein [Candidatus Bathyarchaeota archaeon]MDH5733594.1 hypothetical protein [Candidatus Bathyarchaeota archaeon]